MKSVSKAILIGFAAFVAVAVLLLLALNLYIQSPATQARIQEELSHALHLPLVITNTSLSPWSELRINGIAVPAEKGNFLEATGFSARYKVLPLFRKRLVIYDMRFQSPKIFWVQNDKGKWKLPALAKAPQEARDTLSEKKEKKKKTDKDDFEVVLDGFKISDGSVELIDKVGNRVALLSDINIDYSTIADQQIEGTATIARVNYADTFFFENVRTPFKYIGPDFSLPDLQGTLGDGPVHASIDLQPDDPKSPFTARIAFDNADVARLSTDAGWASGRATGMLAGTLEITGRTRDMAKATGKGQLTLRNATIRQMDLLQTLGEVLQFDELIQLHVNSGVADFHFENEKVTVDQLMLESPDLKLSAQGIARFNRKLDLDARLLVDDRTLKRRPAFIRDLFAATNENGEHAIDFKVGGTIDKPKTDLAEKLLGKSLGDQFDNVVSRLFGFGKKKDEEKKKDEKKKKKKDGLDAAPKPAAPPAGDEPPVPSAGGRPVPSGPSASPSPAAPNP